MIGYGETLKILVGLSEEGGWTMPDNEQIASYLDKTGQILTSWLGKNLPELSQDWWEDNVLAKLSDAQGNRVRNKGISALSGLDLAALLRVFDQNWYELSQRHQFSYEDRHFLKEMPDIRNRWAHKPADGYKPDDIYRDLDTIQRFIALIGPGDPLISQIQETKTDIFASKAAEVTEAANPFVAEGPAQDIQTLKGEEKKGPTPNRAKNLAIRVPWQDNGWTGLVCADPQKNTACIRLKSIAENKKTEFECPLAGKDFSSLSPEELKKIPCLKENAAFLSNGEFSFFEEYPYSTYTGLTHIKPTKVCIFPNTLISRPFRWMRVEDTPAKKIITGFNIRREEEYKASHKRYNKPITKTWINEPRNQRAVIEYYYDGVSENSLLIPYLKNVPFTDDGRRIVLGAGYVKKIHENQQYDSSDQNINDMPLLWEKVIEHDLLNNGFLIPYKKLYDYWIKNNQPDIDKYLLFVDDDYRTEFSNGSECVSYDALLSILTKAKDILLAISNDILSIDLDFAAKSKWIEAQIGRLSGERGIFPGIGNLLLASGIFIIQVEGEEKNIALDLLKHISFDGSPESINALINVIDNESRLTVKQREKAKLFISARLKILYNFSRFTFSEAQFNAILNDDYGCSPDNPYLLFENSLDKKDELKIPLNKIDNGMFFDIERQRTADDLVLLDPDSKERLRAFIIRELDEQSQKNGHSLLPLEYLLELINSRDLLHKLNFDKDDFSLPSYKEYIEEKIIIKEIEGEKYLKLCSLEKYDDVSRNEVNARLAADKLSIDTGVFEEILTESLSLFEGNETGEGKAAKKEKLAALQQLSTRKISVLIGDAGTGKTTVLSALCRHNDIKSKVQLLAPTGKARVRMWDATGKQYETNTIAGYLIADNCYDWNTGRYKVPEKSKVELSGANVIIDESSMLTTEMFAAILKSCSQARRIIFVGDPNQLPPIGCGKPFSDLVDYLSEKYPENVAKLTCAMRTEMSETNDFASWFKGGSGSDEGVFDKVELNTDSRKGIRFRQYEDDLQEAVLDEIVKISGMKDRDDIQGFDISLGAVINDQYTNFNQGASYFCHGINEGAGSRAEGWQILSPINNSPDGTVGINDLIHARYRPTTFDYGIEKNSYFSEVKGLQKIGVGDKVICTENGSSEGFYDEKYNKGKIFDYIANGEIGIRVSSAKNNFFPNVEFSTQLGVSYWGKKDSKGKMRQWKYGDENSDGNLELAYAITIHKAQGSQFNNVILVLNKNSGMLSRELIYTAITRQRAGLVILFNDNIRQLLKYSGDLHSILAKRCTDLFADPKFIGLSEGWYEEAKIHKTKRGDMVRSKSEVIIANELENAGLDWHYENDNQFVEINGKKLLPDFVIHHKGKTYYWEHLGLLEKAKYRKNWEEKEKCYLSRDDIVLKVTRDKQNGAINTENVIAVIKEILNG
jgi:ATP-dependent exoDNAse (exonuclease V) alpha subunit